VWFRARLAPANPFGGNGVLHENSLSSGDRPVARGQDVRAARDLLAPVYEWFTESFDTRDLIEAKALLG